MRGEQRLPGQLVNCEGKNEDGMVTGRLLLSKRKQSISGLTEGQQGYQRSSLDYIQKNTLKFASLKQMREQCIRCDTRYLRGDDLTEKRSKEKKQWN